MVTFVSASTFALALANLTWPGSLITSLKDQLFGWGRIGARAVPARSASGGVTGLGEIRACPALEVAASRDGSRSANVAEDCLVIP